MTDEPTSSVDVVERAAPVTLRRRNPTRTVLEWVIILVVAVGVSFFVRTFAFQTFFIPSGSMEPTLMVGDRIVVDKLSVDFGSINIGDILVFKAPPTENCGGPPVTDLVKRVIGTPGDTLTSKGNTIYVNGRPLAEKWTHTEPLGPAIGVVHLKANQYFMMGDNHSDSCDSRSWGPITRSDVIGKAFLRIWPLSRFGSL